MREFIFIYKIPLFKFQVTTHSSLSIIVVSNTHVVAVCIDRKKCAKETKHKFIQFDLWSIEVIVMKA